MSCSNAEGHTVDISELTGAQENELNFSTIGSEQIGGSWLCIVNSTFHSENGDVWPEERKFESTICQTIGHRTAGVHAIAYECSIIDAVFFFLEVTMRTGNLCTFVDSCIGVRV